MGQGTSFAAVASMTAIGTGSGGGRAGRTLIFGATLLVRRVHPVPLRRVDSGITPATPATFRVVEPQRDA